MKMTSGEAAYLAMTVVAWLGFAIVLFWASLED
jgi:hypothetical protein